MVIDTMTNTEINRAVTNDFLIISNGSTLERLSNQYDKQRKKLKIDPSLTYSVCYPIKSKAKNNWLFFFSKAPSIERYKGTESINFASVLLYNSQSMLRAAKITVSQNAGSVDGICLYNAHLFKRYCERMKLEISEPIDKIKHFFINNGYSQGQLIKKDGRDFLISICKNGFMLGELSSDKSVVIYKTFITRNEAKPNQLDLEAELINNLQTEIESLINESDFDNNKYSLYADIAKGVRQ